MKKILVMFAAMLFVVALAAVAGAAGKTYTLEGPVVSVDSDKNVITVHSVEGTTAAADNRWKGDVPFQVTDKTKIMTEDGSDMALGDLHKGDNVRVKFHLKGKKQIADQIGMTPKVRPRP